MARIRTIKPAFFSSLSNADLPIPTRMTWIGLWTYVDDKGRAVDDARLVKAAIWPLDDAYTAKKVEADLVTLEKAGKIGRYIHDGQRYFAVVKWKDHQRIDKPQPSKLPPAPWEEDSGNDPGMPPPNAGSVPGTMPPKAGGEVEGNGREGNGGGMEGNGNGVSSSSSHQRVGRPAADDDETSTPVSRALGVIANRRIDAAVAGGLEILNHGAYRRQTLRGVDIEFGDEVIRMLCDGMEPDDVADALVPAVSAVKRYPELSAVPDGEWVEQTDDDGRLLGAKWVAS